MKNSVKIAIILGIVASFFPAYSMIPSEHCLEKKTSKTVNPFFVDKELDLSLTIIEILEQSDKTKNKKSLKTICDSISQGTPVSFNQRIIKSNPRNFRLIVVIPSQNPVSVFTSIEDWLKAPVYMSLKNWLTRKGLVGKKKRKAIFSAIFQGERNRKKQLTYIQNKLEIEIPKDLISIIIEYLPEFNVGKERERLIAKAEQKFIAEQQSRLTRFFRKHSHHNAH